jgi:signal transduction histidine kinase
MLIQKRLSDLKSDFINNMTHELKTPLSTISVASSSLINPDLSLNRNKIKELSNLIKKTNKHLSDLIDRILDITIWEKDQVKPRYKKIDLENFIREAVGTFQLEMNHHPADVTISLDLKNKFAFIDEIHMTTVINNLLLNALKYSNNDTKIHIDLKNDEILRITVSDNGPGIPREEQKHVFDKFYRGKSSRKKAIKGLGLGLYYVKQIVLAHNGEIRLDSEPGKGTSFEIIIPANDEYTAGRG